MMIISNTNKKNINSIEQKNPSFGIKIKKDCKYHNLVNYFSTKWGRDYVDIAMKRIETIGSDKDSLVFYPIRNGRVEYDICSNDSFGMRIRQFVAKVESNWQSMGFGGARYKTKSDPMDLYVEIAHDYSNFNKARNSSNNIKKNNKDSAKLNNPFEDFEEIYDPNKGISGYYGF